MATVSPPLLDRRSIAGGVVLVAALLVGSIAVAPSAWAGHSEVEASVVCVDGERILDWSWTAFRHREGDPLPGFVAVEYDTGSSAVIATTSLVDPEQETTGSTVLSPPAGATQVLVHVYAYWPDSEFLVEWLDFSTEPMALPAPCEVQVDPAPPVQTTTTTTQETTTTTSGSGVLPTIVTTAPPAASGGVGAQNPAAAASAQVGAQAVGTQTLPNTGSSNGVLAAVAVVLLAIGSGMVVASRRTLHTVSVSSGEVTETR